MRAVSKALGAGLLAMAAARPARLAAATGRGRGSRRPRLRPPPSPRRQPGPGSATEPTAGRCPSTGSSPYQEPVIGGNYGGYIGMAGNWARTEGCKTGNFLAWSPANAGQANTNYTKYHIGIGTGVYWYMGGPGVDPHWNGTTTEASNWGAAAGGVGARGDEEPARSPTRCSGPTSRCRGSQPAPRQRLEQRLHLAVQRRDRAAAPSPRPSTGRCSTGSRPTSPSHSKYKVGVYSAAPIWPQHLRHRHSDARSRTPTSGPTAGDLAPVGRARPAGACTARRRARSSSAGRPRRASTR